MEKYCASRPPTSYSTSPPTLQSSDSIQIATWNCRGLHNSLPYIRHLIAKGIDILVLQEHWPWPFELSELESIDSNFSYSAVCDSRLSPTSTLTRGCGGCAILWKNYVVYPCCCHVKSQIGSNLRHPSPH